MLVSAVTKRLPYAGSAFTRVIEGCFLATLLFSKGSSCLVLNDFWSRDILPSCVLRGAALFLFYKASAAERRQPPKARQPLSINVVVGSPGCCERGVPAPICGGEPRVGKVDFSLSRITCYIERRPLTSHACCVCPAIGTDRLRAPPQACRKIHDCDAAAESRGGREPGAPTGS